MSLFRVKILQFFIDKFLLVKGVKNYDNYQQISLIRRYEMKKSIIYARYVFKFLISFSGLGRESM